MWAVCNDVLPKNIAGKEEKKRNFLMKKPDKHYIYWVIISSDQLLSPVRLFATP